MPRVAWLIPFDDTAFALSYHNGLFFPGQVRIAEMGIFCYAAADLLSSRNEILLEMERLAAKKRFPIVGPLVGRLLAQMAGAIGARRVFEFGSGFGYSAYWFVKGMNGQGRVVFTDDEEENAQLARGFLKRVGLDSCLQVEVGDALEIIDRQSGTFDIIFIDCDKERYPLAFEKALPRIRPGGLLETKDGYPEGTFGEQGELR